MNTPSVAHPAETYTRTPDFTAHIAGLKFPANLWAVFAITDQPFTSDHIVSTLRIQREAADAAISTLEQHRLIQKQVIGWEEFLAASKPAAPVQPAVTPRIETPEPPVAKPLPQPVPVAAPAPVIEIVASPAPIAPAPAPVSVRMAPTPKPVANVAVAFTLSNPVAAARRRQALTGLIEFKLTRQTPAARKGSASPFGRKLRPILDAIIEKGGGGLQGQLLAYRVFLRIPADITAAAGLSSLSLVDNDFTVNDPRLIEALFEAARSVAGLESLPQAA